MINLLYEKSLSYPDRIAIKDLDKNISITYQELWERVEAQKFEGVVALHFEKSISFIIALLSALHQDVLFYPMLPSLPDARKEAMKAILPATIISKLSSAKKSFSPKAEGKAGYVYFTSGSSGTPKAVKVSRKGLLNVIEEQVRIFDMKERKSLWMLSPSFDASLSDILTSLLSGSTLIFKREYTLSSLKEVINQEGIDYIDIPPSLLALLKPEDHPSLKTIVIGGERPDQKVVDLWKERKLFNVYGPTETTICSSIMRCVNWKGEIGLPVKGMKYAVLNEKFHPVKKGEIGELFISGVGVGEGYLNYPNHQFRDGGFLTGDLVLNDVGYPFIGRKDQQIKVNGQMVNLEEINVVVSSYDQTISSKVTFDGRIKLFIKLKDANREKLINFLKTILPAYMMPSTIILMDALPLVNGKIKIPSEAELFLKEILSLLPGSKPESHLMDLGLSSIELLSLQDKLYRKGYLVDIGAFYQYPKIIELAKNFNKVLYIETKDLMKEMDQYTLNEVARGQGKEVLLTGALGALGKKILPKLSNPFVIIRDGDREEKKKIILALNPNARIFFGDLEADSFGLSSADYEELVMKVGNTIHAAAIVNDVKPYSEMKGNVKSTYNILKFCAASNSSLNYISTLSVFVGGVVLDKDIYDDTPLSNTVRLRSGYAQSKWAADYLVGKLCRQPYNIFRLGLLIENSQFFTMALESIASGKLDAADENLAIDLTPIDFAAETIIKLKDDFKGSRVLTKYKKGITLGKMRDLTPRREAKFSLVAGRAVEEDFSGIDIFLATGFTFNHTLDVDGETQEELFRRIGKN